MYTSFFSDPCVITYMYVFMFECSLRRQRPFLVFVTRRGDEEKMRTNIDQTNGMLTSSIALSLTHNTRQSPPKLIFISCIFVNWKTISPLEIHFSLRKVTIFLERDAIKVLSCRDSHSHPQLSEKFHFSLPLNLSCAFLTDDPITPRM